jgi:hypothetical protein
MHPNPEITLDDILVFIPLVILVGCLFVDAIMQLVEHFKAGR